MLKKARDAGTDVHLALLEYRNTPVSGTAFSPPHMLLGRPLRSKIPVASKKPIPATVQPRAQLTRQQERQKVHYDRTAKPMKELQPGDVVRIRKGSTWSDPAIVTRADKAPLWYWVDTGPRVLRRNRRHLLKTGELPVSDQRQNIDMQEATDTPLPDNGEELPGTNRRSRQ